VEIELVPDPGPDDPAARAVAEALAREGLAAGARPAGSIGAWRRAGVEAAVERAVAPDGTCRNRSAPSGPSANGLAQGG